MAAVLFALRTCFCFHHKSPLFPEGNRGDAYWGFFRNYSTGSRGSVMFQQT